MRALPDQAQNPGFDDPISADERADNARLLRLIFDHAGEGISVFDGALRLQAWNARFLTLTRIDPAVVRVGTPLHELLLTLARSGEFGPCDPEAEAQRRLALLASGPASVTERTRLDGRTLELRRSPTPGGGFLMLYADITERIAAQATLSDQQRMLTLLIERTEQGIWFIDTDQRTTDANPAMCRMLGLTLEQMRGRDIFSFVDPVNEQIFRTQVRRRTQGQAEGYEITLLRSDGEPVHCFNNATPLLDAKGRQVGAVGMFSDITPLKRAEQQVRLTSDLLVQKSRVLEVTLDSLSQGVLSIDVHGRTNAWNRRFLDLLEIPEALMQTRPTLQAVREYQMAQGHIDRDAIGTDPQAWKLRPAMYQRTRKDGIVLEVQTHAAADGSMVRTYTDVTASVRARHALQESESRFRSMADAAPAFIWLADEQGSPQWFNQRWLDFTGRTLAQELAQDWSQRLHVDDLATCRALYRDASARREPFEVEYRALAADARMCWLVDKGIARFTPDGRFDGYIVYGWDITERKATQAALLAAKDEAERANRAKSEFLSRMSHELRTPLNAVLGFGQLLEVDRADPLSLLQQSRVQELLRGGRHLLSLINDVLDLARIEAGTLHLSLAPVALAGLSQECLRLVQAAAAERGIQLLPVTGSDTGAHVLADPTRLKQVLLNLLSNAIKYNRPAGQVQLAWQADAGGSVRIEVRDTGPGLDASQQERLFHAFERLDAARTEVEGAGIGLALSKWLVDLMQGHIGVHSTPGEGSVFWISLAAAAAPAGAAADAASAMPPPRAPPVAARRHTVLYIEDNEVNQLLMEGVLAQRPGVQLLMAGLPLEGLALAAQAQPDVVLLDIQLPGFDGFEVLRRLRAQPATAQVPVVAVSANAMPADRERAAAAGFADYVTKPIDIGRLLAVVDRLLQG